MINIWPTTVYHHVHCKTPIVVTIQTVPFLSWHRWPAPLPVTRDGTRLPSDSSFEQLHGVVTNTSWFSTPPSLSTASLSRFYQWQDQNPLLGPRQLWGAGWEGLLCTGVPSTVFNGFMICTSYITFTHIPLIYTRFKNGPEYFTWSYDVTIKKRMMYKRHGCHPTDTGTVYTILCLSQSSTLKVSQKDQFWKVLANIDGFWCTTLRFTKDINKYETKNVLVVGGGLWMCSLIHFTMIVFQIPALTGMWIFSAVRYGTWPQKLFTHSCQSQSSHAICCSDSARLRGRFRAEQVSGYLQRNDPDILIVSHW